MTSASLHTKIHGAPQPHTTQRTVASQTSGTERERNLAAWYAVWLEPEDA